MFDVAIIGGGIAAVEAARYLVASKQNIKVAFISGGHFVKAITSIDPISGTLFDFTLDDIDVRDSFGGGENVMVYPQRAAQLDHGKVVLDDGVLVEFKRLLLCTGAVPKSPIEADSDKILTLRDTKSAKQLNEKLSGAKKIVLIGSGGIALELVHAINNVEIVWCSRDVFG